MSVRDLYNNVKAQLSLLAVAITAGVNGTGVDLAGFSSALFVLSCGTMGGSATPTVTLKLQESDDNTTFTDIAATDLQGGALPATIGAAEAAQVYERGYLGTKRYDRVICSAVAGTSPSLPCAATVIKGHPIHASTH